MSTDVQGPVLHVQYADKSAVYHAYLSFCREGGLFVPTAHAAHIGTPVQLLVDLPGDASQHAVSGKVVWINYGKRKGLGIHFLGDEFGRQLRTAIENILGGGIKAPMPTYTM